jgi:hypothetical protein
MVDCYFADENVLSTRWRVDQERPGPGGQGPPPWAGGSRTPKFTKIYVFWVTVGRYELIFGEIEAEWQEEAF